MTGSSNTALHNVTEILKKLGHDIKESDWIVTQIFPKIANINCHVLDCHSSYIFQYHIDAVSVLGANFLGSSDWALQPVRYYSDIRHFQSGVPTIHSLSVAPYDSIFYCKKLRALI